MGIFDWVCLGIVGLIIASIGLVGILVHQQVKADKRGEE